MIKNTIAGFIAGFIASIGVLGISALITDETTISNSIQGEQGIQGEIGIRGYTGAQGKQGIQGNDGISVTVDQVLTALDEREEVIEIEINLADIGVGTSTMVMLKEGIYKITTTHAGSDYFGARLIGHGKNVILASQNGYVYSQEEIKITDEGEYKINVTSTGDWTVDIITR